MFHHQSSIPDLIEQPHSQAIHTNDFKIVICLKKRDKY